VSTVQNMNQVVSLGAARLGQGEDFATLTWIRDELSGFSYLLGIDGVIADGAITKLAWITSYLNTQKTLSFGDSTLSGYLSDAITDLLTLIAEIFSEEDAREARYVLALRCQSRIEIVMEHVAGRC